MKCTAFLLVAVSLSAFSQSTPTIRTFEDLDKVLAGKTLPECQANFHQCQQSLSDLQEWADRNYPIGLRLSAENAQLRTQMATLDRRESRIEIFLSFVGLGVGIFLAWLTMRSIKRLWPVSQQNRQLIVLLACASWISISALLAANNTRLATHPVNLVFTFAAYSLPALAFGGIAIWWFGKSKPGVLS